MERCGSIILLGVLLPYVCGIPFSLHKDGSETTRVCNCDSVDFWLPRRKDSSLELPSYEELTPSLDNSLNLDKKAGKYLRLRLQRDCNHTWLNKDEASTLNGNVSFKSESREDGSIEVWLKDGLRCMSFWMKCHESQKSICVGIDVLAKDFSQSTKRKLLMVVPDDKEEKISYGHYGIIMSAFVLCLMVILVALCGSSSTNSGEVYTGADQTVEIISSAKVQSIHRKDISIENEETDAKNVGHPEGVGPDRSSTSDPKAVVDHDKVSVAITDNGPHKDASDTTDGQVFVKEKDYEKGSKNKKENSSEKAEKNKKEKCTTKEKSKEKDSLKEKDRKEKEGEKEKNKKERDSLKEKNKKEKGSKKEDRNKKGEKGKEVRPSRAHSSPSETAEPKGFSKLRFSLKGNASATAEDRKSAKKQKEKGKTKSLSDFSPSRSPSTSNRRSLVHRELPQRPSQGSTEGVPATDDNYAEPFDCKVRPEVVANEIDDEDEDGNYETVTNQMTGRAMVSAKNEVLESCRKSSSASASRRQVLAKEPEDDNIFYDSVDEKRERKGTGERSNVQEKTLDVSDTYEVVEESTKRQRSELKPEANSQDLYEIVDSRNTLDVYEEPKIGRKRSASDIVTGSSSTMTEAGHKSMSLDRGRSTAPPLPPLRIQGPIQWGNHASGESEVELIEPYTLTTKIGDFIVQETSTSTIPNSMKANARVQPPVSPDELEVMYTKVDKQKQKIDRLKVKRESSVELDECKKEEDDGAAMGTNAALGAIANTVIAALVVNDNHEYESISTLKRNPVTFIEGEDLYDDAVPSNTTS